MTRALVVWQWRDGKRGHERQCAGLVQALGERLPLSYHVLDVPRPGLRRFAAFVAGVVRAGAALPSPDLIVGAGRACQWPLLAARRARGGRAIYLMRPQLPVACFDLCIVPRHDRPPPASNVFVSDGPLNPMRAAATRDSMLGLILLGGPSAHYRWDDDALAAQIDLLLALHPDLTWYASDSRRSPLALGRRLAARGDLIFKSHHDTPDEWLPAQLARAAQAWVSTDSVAMVYEAFSAGAAVGLLEVPARRADRITAIATDLRARGLVTTLGAPHRTVAPPALAEAARCAELILTRWPDLANRA